MQLSDLIASIGVILLLIAFFLNLRKMLSTESVTYSMLNIVGAGMCGFSSYLISFYPFMILEGIWVSVALYSLMKRKFHVKHELESK